MAKLCPTNPTLAHFFPLPLPKVFCFYDYYYCYPPLPLCLFQSFNQKSEQRKIVWNKIQYQFLLTFSHEPRNICKRHQDVHWKTVLLLNVTENVLQVVPSTKRPPNNMSSQQNVPSTKHILNKMYPQQNVPSSKTSPQQNIFSTKCTLNKTSPQQNINSPKSTRQNVLSTIQSLNLTSSRHYVNLKKHSTKRLCN